MTAEKFSIEENIKSVKFEDDYCDGGTVRVEFIRGGVEASLTLELVGFFEDGNLDTYNYNAYLNIDEDEDPEAWEEADAVVDFTGKGGNQEARQIFEAHLSKLAAERFPEERTEAMNGGPNYGGSSKGAATSSQK